VFCGICFALLNVKIAV